MKKLIILCLILFQNLIFGEAISGRWEFSAGKTRNAKELYTLEVINSFTATISLSTETSKSPLLIILDKDNNIVDSISSNGYVQTSSNLELDKTPYKIIATTANVGDTADYTLSVNGGSGNFSLYKRAADTIVKPFIIGDFMGAQLSINYDTNADYTTLQKYKDCGFNTFGLGIQFQNPDWKDDDFTVIEKYFSYRADIADSLGMYLFAYDVHKYRGFYPTGDTRKKLHLYKNINSKYKDNVLGYFLRDEPHPRHFEDESPYLKKKSHYFSHDDKKLVYVNLHQFNSHTVHKDTVLKFFNNLLPDSVFIEVDTTYDIDTIKTSNKVIYDTLGIIKIDSIFSSDSSTIADTLYPGLKHKYFDSLSIEKNWQHYKEYVHSYFYNSSANVISFDMYPLTASSYLRWKGRYHYFEILDLFGKAAKETEKEFWIINNAFNRLKKGKPTLNRMRYETNTALLYGIKGLVWFSYEMGKDTSNQYIAPQEYKSWADNDPEIYNALRQVNNEASTIGNLRLKLKWDKVIHGSTIDPLSNIPDSAIPHLETQFLENGKTVSLQGSDADFFALGRYTDHNNIPYYYVMNKHHDANKSYSVTIPVYEKDVFYYDMSTKTFKPLSDHSNYYHNGNSVTITVPPAEIVVLKIGKSINVAPIFNQLLAN